MHPPGHCAKALGLLESAPGRGKAVAVKGLCSSGAGAGGHVAKVLSTEVGLGNTEVIGTAEGDGQTVIELSILPLLESQL